MLSNSCNKYAASVIVIAALVGCASPAPDLPRYTGQAVEPGYISVTPTTTAQGTTAVVRRIAMVSKAIWDELPVDEQQQISAAHDIRLLELTNYGIIIDVQGADQSQPGTNSGAALGGAVASAAVIDRALRGNNYSAGGHLAAGLLGAAIGSSLDRAPTTQFQFRYTVKQGDGEIQYFDEVKSSSFRHSVGVCVLLPDLTLVSQQVCQQTVDTFKKRHLPTPKQNANT